MKVACIGAGPAGLYLAILMKLRDPECDVALFERNQEGIAQGWGVVFWDDLLDDLRSNDLQSAHAILAQSFRWTDQVIDIKGRKVRGGGGGFGICRRQLLTILTNRALELGVTVHFGYEFAATDPLPTADLVVASDGIGSQVRRRYAEQFDTRVAVGRNKYVWLGTSRVFDAFTFGFVSTKAGWIWFHAYAYSPEMSTFIVECSPETWTGLGFDTMDAGESLGALEDIFEKYLCGHRLISRPCKGMQLPWVNFRNTTNRTWHMNNIALIGDAAHTTHFSIGSGTRLAIQDAIALADALHKHSDVGAALKAYEKERKRALARPNLEAGSSARWFEGISRYMDLDAHQFYRLLMNRRSRIMPFLPPRLYYRVYNVRHIKGLRKLRRGIASTKHAMRDIFDRLTGKTTATAR